MVRAGERHAIDLDQEVIGGGVGRGETKKGRSEDLPLIAAA